MVQGNQHFIKLLLRIYEPTEGNIYINDELKAAIDAYYKQYGA